ncbi:lanthionine synthetase LanC family protein [Kribbella sp. C-35]|uniref:lanthionine synthetase LanC family protein n=1 Tax=Kribbella sp. C-35 TaxID=2789276 RepID=UPI00397BC40D
MGYLDPYVLPADALITPLSRLPATYREKIDAGAGDYAVTRPRSRLPSTVVDARTAALLERFRQPKTIVDAVLELSLTEGLDPRAILDDAAQMVRRFADEGVLAPADSPLAAPIVSELARGDRLGQIEVLEPVQVLVDVEVHRGRAADGTPVAVKLARRAADTNALTALAHEARVLDRLGGDVAPELVASGDLDGRPWIATRWCEGVDAATAAAALRGTDATPGALLRLVEAVLDAYCRLHAHGVVHGDVHPRNLVVDDAGIVTVLDFGTAVLDGACADGHAGSRPGVDLYAEPEVAEAALAGAPLPAPTIAGEQFALGVLASVLLVGDHPYGFTADPRELLRRIIDRPPSFDDRLSGIAGVEPVIRRALQRHPGDRHASTAALLDAFRAARPRADARPTSGPRSRSSGPDRLMTAVLDRLAPQRARFDPPSVADPMAMHGLAGRAWAILRCAESRGDPELLAVADLWATEAAAAAADKPSLLYGAAGVHVVRLAVARARADEAEQAAALAAFVDAASEPSVGADVTHGRAGLLLGCCTALRDAPPAERRLLAGLGARLADGLEADANAPYGVAHGIAGRLLALLRWAEVTGVPPGERVVERLDTLAGAVAGATRRRQWAYAGAPHSLVASWCNGFAGLVHVWLAAYRVLGDDRWRHLAEQAGTSVEHGLDTMSGDLCCGLGGQAYALLALYRASGEARWLESSRRLAEGAAEVITRVRPDVRDSLFAGEPGVAALAADLAHPADARMPLVDP